MGLFSIIVLGCHGRPFWSDSFQFWEFLYIVSLIVFAAFLLLLNFYFIFLFCFQSLFSGRLLKLCLLSHYIEFFILTFFIAKGFFFSSLNLFFKKIFFSDAISLSFLSLRMFITVFWSLCLFPQSSCFCLFWSLSFWWLFSNI